MNLSGIEPRADYSEGSGAGFTIVTHYLSHQTTEKSNCFTLLSCLSILTNFKGFAKSASNRLNNKV
jgi:hypothetical protein